MFIILPIIPDIDPDRIISFSGKPMFFLSKVDHNLILFKIQVDNITIYIIMNMYLCFIAAIIIIFFSLLHSRFNFLNA